MASTITAVALSAIQAWAVLSVFVQALASILYDHVRKTWDSVYSQKAVIGVSLLVMAATVGPAYFQDETMQGVDIVYECFFFPTAEAAVNYGLSYVYYCARFVLIQYNNFMVYVRTCFSEFFDALSSAGTGASSVGVLLILNDVWDFLICVLKIFAEKPEYAIPYVQPLQSEFVTGIDCVGDALFQAVDLAASTGDYWGAVGAAVNGTVRCSYYFLDVITGGPLIPGGGAGPYIKSALDVGSCLATAAVGAAGRVMDGTLLSSARGIVQETVECLKPPVRAVLGPQNGGTADELVERLACAFYVTADAAGSVVSGGFLADDAYFRGYFLGAGLSCSPLFDSECIASGGASGCGPTHDYEQEYATCVADLAVFATRGYAEGMIRGLTNAFACFLTTWKQIFAIYYLALESVLPITCSGPVDESSIGNAFLALLGHVVDCLGDVLYAVTDGKYSDFWDFLFDQLEAIIFDLFSFAFDVYHSFECFQTEEYGRCIGGYPADGCDLSGCLRMPFDCLRARDYSYLRPLLSTDVFEVAYGFFDVVDTVVCPFSSMIRCFQGIGPCTAARASDGIDGQFTCTRDAFECVANGGGAGYTWLSWLGQAGSAVADFLHTTFGSFASFRDRTLAANACFGGDFTRCVDSYPRSGQCSIASCFSRAFACVQAADPPYVAPLRELGIFGAAVDLFAFIDSVVCPFVAISDCVSGIGPCKARGGDDLGCGASAFRCVRDKGGPFSFIGSAVYEVLSFFQKVVDFATTAIRYINGGVYGLTKLGSCFHLDIPAYCYTSCPSWWTEYPSSSYMNPNLPKSSGVQALVTCTKGSYPTRDNGVPTCSPSQYYFGGCYDNCRDGMIASQTICRRACPGDYSWTGLGNCYNGGGYTCNKCNRPCAKINCCSGREDCDTDTWCTCTINAKTITVDYYNNPLRIATYCGSEYVYRAGLCYKACADHYSTDGVSRCWEDCPSGFTDGGAFCSRPKERCDGGRKASCSCTFDLGSNSVLYDPFGWVQEVFECFGDVDFGPRDSATRKRGGEWAAAGGEAHNETSAKEKMARALHGYSEEEKADRWKAQLSKWGVDPGGVCGSVLHSRTLHDVYLDPGSDESRTALYKFCLMVHAVSSSVPSAFVFPSERKDYPYYETPRGMETARPPAAEPPAGVEQGGGDPPLEGGRGSEEGDKAPSIAERGVSFYLAAPRLVGDLPSVASRFGRAAAAALHSTPLGAAVAEAVATVPDIGLLAKNHAAAKRLDPGARPDPELEKRAKEVLSRLKTAAKETFRGCGGACAKNARGGRSNTNDTWSSLFMPGAPLEALGSLAKDKAKRVADEYERRGMHRKLSLLSRLWSRAAPGFDPRDWLVARTAAAAYDLYSSRGRGLAESLRGSDPARKRHADKGSVPGPFGNFRENGASFYPLLVSKDYAPRAGGLTPKISRQQFNDYMSAIIANRTRRAAAAGASATQEATKAPGAKPTPRVVSLLLDALDYAAYPLAGGTQAATDAWFALAGKLGNANFSDAANQTSRLFRDAVTCSLPSQIDGAETYNPFCLPLLPENTLSAALLAPPPNSVVPMQLPWPSGLVRSNCTNGPDAGYPVPECDNPFLPECGFDRLHDNCARGDGSPRPFCPACQYCKRTYGSCYDLGFLDGYDNIFYLAANLPRAYSGLFERPYPGGPAQAVQMLVLAGLVAWPIKSVPFHAPVLLYSVFQGNWWPLTLYAAMAVDASLFRILFGFHLASLFLAGYVPHLPAFSPMAVVADLVDYLRDVPILSFFAGLAVEHTALGKASRFAYPGGSIPPEDDLCFFWTAGNLMFLMVTRAFFAYAAYTVYRSTVAALRLASGGTAVINTFARDMRYVAAYKKALKLD